MTRLNMAIWKTFLEAFSMPKMEVNFPGLAYKLITFLHKDSAKELGPG